mgnify:CR=1 FL=1
MKYGLIWVLALLALWGGVVKVSAEEVSAPPAVEIERLGLDPFYEKYLSYRGFPIVASAKVSDFALKEASYLIGQMLSGRDDVIQAMIENKVRLSIMAPDEYTTDVPEHSTLEPKAYWDKRARGLGASRERPAVSVGEENLLGYRGDPYSTESIMIHEFAHAIHQMGLVEVDPAFQEKLEQAYSRAGIAGLWKGKYAGTNPSEYWAEGVQSWFDTNRENDFEHNHVNTREELKQHDGELAALVESAFGNGEWRYLLPAKREESDHLMGYDPDRSPQFIWPEEMVTAYELLERGDDKKELELQKMDSFVYKDATTKSGPSVKLRFENKTDQRLTVYWVGFDGLRRQYAVIDPGRKYEQGTYGGHLWVIVDESLKDFGWLRAAGEDCRVELK